MGLFETLVGFVLGILGNYLSTATQPPITNPWQRRLEDHLADQAALREALSARRSLRDELRLACRNLAQNLALSGDLSDQERPIWRLLGDPDVQNDLADWLMLGGIQEGEPVRARLERRMEQALAQGGASIEQIAAFKAQYFDMLDRAIFSVQLLANWRHQLSLDYLRQQVTTLRRLAEQQAGIFLAEDWQAALERYYAAALNAWDIIDLRNLPQDIQSATQNLLLRQLYMPLRIIVEVERERAADEAAFARLEQQRDLRRLREAGRIAFSDDPTARERVPVGARLDAARRLVVLGDPGGGKSTLLRWMATGYLLRLINDPAVAAIPDIETLPQQNWIPVLIRCRDLGEADLCRSFTDFLAQHLRKSELQPEDA